MAIGPRGSHIPSLLNELLCPSFWHYENDDCRFDTRTGLQSVTKQITWKQGKWLGDKGNENVDLVAYDTPWLGDTYESDQQTLRV